MRLVWLEALDNVLVLLLLDADRETTLRTHDAEGFVATLPESERDKLKGNRLFKVPEFRIPNAALDAPMDEVLASLRNAKAAADGR